MDSVDRQGRNNEKERKKESDGERSVKEKSKTKNIEK